MLSDARPFTITPGFVAENDTHVESAIIPSDKCFIFIPDHIFGTLVHLVSNVNDSLLYENDLIDVIELFEDHAVGARMSVLHISQQLDHEISVSLVSPAVFVPVRILNFESVSENIQEGAVVILAVYFSLDLFG